MHAFDENMRPPSPSSEVADTLDAAVIGPHGPGRTDFRASAWDFGSSEVRDALRGGKPVVALETAVLTHGLPSPHHRVAMQRMFDAVLQSGAVPAVVGVRRGRLVVGLDAAAIDELARRAEAMMAAGSHSEGTSPARVDQAGSAILFTKVSTRDLAWAAVAKADGGTTVAATLTACRLAGVRVFATGGIGGVHRGWTQTMDVSADLDELGRTPCAVVSAGAKSILDLAATLEVLESRGVPVIGYRTNCFPQFHTRGATTLPAPRRLESVAEVAELCRVHWHDLRLTTAVLVAIPIPEAEALDQPAMERAVERALRAAEAAGVRGAALTPFLLGAVAEASGGDSIRANLALLEHNARVAGELAVALAERRGPAIARSS